jgi:hypothetical protein
MNVSDSHLRGRPPTPHLYLGIGSHMVSGGATRPWQHLWGLCRKGPLGSARVPGRSLMHSRPPSCGLCNSG